MHVYLVSTDRTIPPFDRSVGEMKVHGRTLRAVQEQVLQALRCTVERIGDLRDVRRLPCLVLSDDLYFTYHALAGFLRELRRSASRTAAGWSFNARAALKATELTETFVPTFQGAELLDADGVTFRAYDCYWLSQFDPGQPLARQAELLPIPYRVKRLRSRTNRYFDPSGVFATPVSLAYMTPIRHWASLVAANLLGMADFFVQTARRRILATATLPLRMLWRAGSLRRASLAGKLYLAGPKCRVHPSAHVEGAVLGQRVRIGPHAVVRGAVIGDGTQIGPGAIIEGCTLGQKVTVNGNTLLRGSVADDEASLGSWFNQLSLIGQGAVMCPDSGIMDYQFRGSVRVAFQGRTIPSGSRLLGGCLGDRAFLGPGVKLLCGQELPNDCVLVENPRALVRNLDHPLPDNVVRIDAGRKADRRARLRPNLAMGDGLRILDEE